MSKFNLKSIEDLKSSGPQIIMGGAPEFKSRDGFGIKGLKSTYGVTFKEFKPLDVAGPLSVAALKDNKVNCANLFSTQSAIPANGFITLEDPKHLAQTEAVVPLIAKSAATADVSQVLNDAELQAHDRQPRRDGQARRGRQGRRLHGGGRLPVEERPQVVLRKSPARRLAGRG